MIYVPANYVNEENLASAEGQGFTINVRFCRNCPMFERDHTPPISYDFEYGWCRRMSDYLTFDDEVPHLVRVNSNSFCNEDDITEENY